MGWWLNVLFLFVVHLIPVTPERVACVLKWVEIGKGDKLPETVVFSHQNEYAVVRFPISGTYVIGSLNISEERAYFPYNRQSQMQLFYEVLTNPYDCVLTWVGSGDENIAALKVVAIESNSNIYVGMAVYQKKFISGSVDGRTNTLQIAMNNLFQPISSSEEIYVLISQSPGLIVEVSNAIFDNDMFESNDILGMDEIYNPTAATVTHVITHSRLMSEKYKFRSQASFSISANVKVDICFLFFFCWQIKEWPIIPDNSQTTPPLVIEKSSDKNITVSRQIKVHPFSSLHACSMFSKANNFSSPWTAKVRFIYPGKTFDETVRIVKSQGQGWADKIFTSFGDAAETNLTGTFQGIFTMGMKFFVSDAGGESTCNQLQRYFQRRKDLKITISNEIDAQKEEREIAEILRKASQHNRS